MNHRDVDKRFTVTRQDLVVFGVDSTVFQQPNDEVSRGQRYPVLAR